MHTLRRDQDGTFWVLFDSGKGQEQMLFQGLKLYQAIDIVNALNGGRGNLDPEVYRTVVGKEVV